MEGLELKLLRVTSELTQWDLAQRLGVHPARVSEMERGRRPITPDVEQALKNIFGVKTSA